MNPVAYFEIPVADMPRAKLFYERVFGTALELARIDGNEMAMFPSAQGQAGASGALACGPSYIPGRSGARIYFSVDDIDETLQLALQQGAEAHYPVTEVPGYGWVAEFIDTEGNCIALHAAVRTAGAAAPQAASDRPVINLGATDLCPFLPSMDFELSKAFYAALGCKLAWSDAQLALFDLGGFRFYLQDHHAKDWADNCMLHISVQDATRCYHEISRTLQSGCFPGARVEPPKQQPYGALVTHVWDPAGVLLHLAQWNRE